MTACNWYKDPQEHIYFLPCKVVSKLNMNDKELLPAGKLHIVTKDHKIVYVLRNYTYPVYIRKIFEIARSLKLSEMRFQIANAHFEENKKLFMQFVPDMFRLIISYLDKSSIVALFLSCHRFHPWILNPDIKNFALNAIEDGHLNLFIWAQQRHAPLPTKALYPGFSLAAKGDLPFIQHLHAHGYPIEDQVLIKAMIQSHSHIVRWCEPLLRDFYQRKPIHLIGVFVHYAEKGDLDMFKWFLARYEGPFGNNIAYSAGRGGSIPILEILRTKNLLEQNVYEGAIFVGHQHVLEWLDAINFPKSAKACAFAITAQKPRLLEWLKANGFQA